MESIFARPSGFARILMWDEFKDFPMRKDYVEPNDYEYEPTAHDEVLEKSASHNASRANWLSYER